MTPAIFFLISLIASFLGSLQAGVVNSAVLKEVLNGRDQWRRSALMLAIGGSAAEAIYAWAVAWVIPYSTTTWLQEIPYLLPSMTVAVGAYIWYIGHSLKIPVAVAYPSDSPVLTNPRIHLLKGLGLGMANLQLLLFWTWIWQLILIDLPSHEDTTHQEPSLLSAFSFGLGASAGAFLLLYCIILYFGQFRNRAMEAKLEVVKRRMSFVLKAAGILVAAYPLWKGLEEFWNA